MQEAHETTLQASPSQSSPEIVSSLAWKSEESYQLACHFWQGFEMFCTVVTHHYQIWIHTWISSTSFSKSKTLPFLSGSLPKSQASLFFPSEVPSWSWEIRTKVSSAMVEVSRTETGQNVWGWGEYLRPEEAGACASFDDTASFTGLSTYFGNPSPIGKYIQEKTIVSDILVSVNILKSSDGMWYSSYRWVSSYKQLELQLSYLWIPRRASRREN